MRKAILAALLGAALLAGCGSDDDMTTREPKTNTAAAPSAAAPVDTIRIKDFEFQPSRATVTAGQKISVPNEDSAPHTLTHEPTSGEPLFDTGTVRGEQTGSFSAPKPGTYNIFCDIHPFMKGEIEVVAS